MEVPNHCCCRGFADIPSGANAILIASSLHKMSCREHQLSRGGCWQFLLESGNAGCQGKRLLQCKSIILACIPRADPCMLDGQRINQGQLSSPSSARVLVRPVLPAVIARQTWAVISFSRLGGCRPESPTPSTNVNTHPLSIQPSPPLSSNLCTTMRFMASGGLVLFSNMGKTRKPYLQEVVRVDKEGGGPLCCGGTESPVP